jgi:diacylglycerol kinase (ATP)
LSAQIYGFTLGANRRLKPFTVEIIEGGVTRYSRTVHVAVGNGRHYGGGMTVTEDASIDDGRLDLYSLEVENWWEMLRLAPALRSGRHQAWAKIRTHSGDAIEIRTSRPRSVNTDGEITTKTPACFRVLRGVLAVYVPGTVQRSGGCTRQDLPFSPSRVNSLKGT